jgi:hypothetical protein
MIHSIDGKSLPHSDYGTWENFLATIEKRGECKGVIYYGASNCNYIVFPDGTLVENFGWHGVSLMKRVAELGPNLVLKQIHEQRAEFLNLLALCRS